MWNPFRAEYQPASSLEDGVTRVSELADLISRMWLGDTQAGCLAGCPDVVETGGSHWAEFRINATTFRGYDTRYADRPTWAKATGMMQAAATVCTKVGYVLPVTTAS